MANNLSRRATVGPPPPYEGATYISFICYFVIENFQIHLCHRTTNAALFAVRISPAPCADSTGSIFGPVIVHVTCPYCQSQIITRILRRPGLLAWLIFGRLAFLGCWLCCFLPLCLSSCQDVEYYCSNCNRLLATYRRL